MVSFQTYSASESHLLDESEGFALKGRAVTEEEEEKESKLNI